MNLPSQGVSSVVQNTQKKCWRQYYIIKNSVPDQKIKRFYILTKKHLLHKCMLVIDFNRCLPPFYKRRGLCQNNFLKKFSTTCTDSSLFLPFKLFSRNRNKRKSLEEYNSCWGIFPLRPFKFLQGLFCKMRFCVVVFGKWHFFDSAKNMPFFLNPRLQIAKDIFFVTVIQRKYKFSTSIFHVVVCRQNVNIQKSRTLN